MNRKIDSIQSIKDNVMKMADKEPDILAVYLLGSARNGYLRQDSDIDLGIMLEPGKKISSLKRIELANKLSYELRRTVDMGVVSSGNLVYAREAMLKGDILYQKDLDKTNLYRANLLGMYIQFNQDRQEVVHAYRA